MKIERIDEKTVKCFLSNEELDAYEITYKDFVLRSDKAKEVVEEIIEQAEEEVGYHSPKFSFDLQIMMLPEKGMILTFSEKEPGESKLEENFLNCLKGMKNVLQGKMEKGLPKENGETKQLQADEITPSVPEHGKSGKNAPECAVFSFQDLGNVCKFASVLPKNLRVISVLYQMEDVYLLFLERGAASYDRYSRLCIRALEFGSLCSADLKRIIYLKEHASCLIKDHALNKLRFIK